MLVVLTDRLDLLSTEAAFFRARRGRARTQTRTLSVNEGGLADGDAKEGIIGRLKRKDGAHKVPEHAVGTELVEKKPNRVGVEKGSKGWCNPALKESAGAGGRRKQQ